LFLFFVIFWFLANNAIKLIEESKFSQLFKNDNQSTINLLGNQLNCADVKPLIWLLQQKSDLESRVIYAKCANGSDFWDLNPSETISTTTTIQSTIPPVEGIMCGIDGNDLNCDANYQTFNITAEIEFLSQRLPEDQKSFENLIIKRTNIEEIPENVFQDISFNYVEIFDAQNLKRIHTNAFNNKTAFNLCKQFYISSPNQLRNYEPDYNFWKAFSSLVCIKDLEISLADGSHEIPDNAFEPINGPQNDLMFMVFDKNNFEITTIGNNAFSELPNLNALSFHDIPIRKISAKAFDFKTSSTTLLSINLLNCSITETSLEEGVFSDAKRPLSLDFSMN
jgi:hypothetical protein